MAHSNPTNIDRRELLPQLFPEPADWLFIGGLAGASRDIAKLTEDGPNIFTMAGVMGGAVPMGLGVALSAPERKVAVVTGDGELLMGIGSLVTVAAAAPQNLTIICEDNAMHGETGRQTGHTAGVTNLEAMAKGAGIPSTMAVSDTAQLTDAAHFIASAPGPRFLLVHVLQTPPSAIKRDLDMTAGRLRFRKYIQETSTLPADNLSS